MQPSHLKPPGRFGSNLSLACASPERPRRATVNCFRTRVVVSTPAREVVEPAAPCSGKSGSKQSIISACVEPIRVGHRGELPAAEVGPENFLGDRRLRDPSHGRLDAEPLSGLDIQMESDLDSGSE